MEAGVLCFLIILSLSFAKPSHDTTIEDYYDYGSEDIIPRKPEKIIVKQEPAKPAPGYEVTEAVDDIPNPNPVVPILTNYTTRKPLNIVPVNARNNTLPDVVTSANGVNNNNNVTPNSKETVDGPYFVDYANEDHDGEEFENDFEHDHEEFHDGLFPSLTEYLYGLKKGIISGLRHLVGKNKYYDVNDSVNINTNPVFLEKLRKKSYYVKNSKYFGDEFDDC